jgi:hypothetical protein
MFFSERDGAGSFAAQGKPQAARSGEAKSARRLQACRNGQGDQALGRRLRGCVRTSGRRTHGRARRASAVPRGKSPSCETIGRQALTGGFRTSSIALALRLKMPPQPQRITAASLGRKRPPKGGQSPSLDGLASALGRRFFALLAIRRVWKDQCLILNFLVWKLIYAGRGVQLLQRRHSSGSGGLFGRRRPVHGGRGGDKS